jgi:APA family basic amino acid/polyamine antiporter
VGSTSRLTASMASEKRLPAVFAFKTKNNAPAAALVGFCIFHGIIVAMIYFDLLTMETVLAIADIFFVGNAAIGILAAAKLLKQTYLKVISIVMAIMFSSLLIFFYTSIPVLIIVALAVFGTRKFFKPQLQQG